MALEEILQKTLSEYKMITPGDRVLVALSGGADSVALLLALYGLKEKLGILELAAAHVNHGLRKEADQDEIFSKNLCEKLGLVCYSIKTDILRIKAEKKIGEEEAGRLVRYEFFTQLKEEHGFSKIATAHHRDDQAETFFLRLFSGSALRGLCGIPPVREDGVIRPLLFVSKEEILYYLKQQQQEFVTDETNYSPDYAKRNEIRLILLPLLSERFHPRIKEAISKTARILSYDCDYLEKAAGEHYRKLAIQTKDQLLFPLAALQSLPKAMQSRVLEKGCREAFGISPSARQILFFLSLVEQGQTGKTISLGKTALAGVSYSHFFFCEKKIEKDYCYQLQLGVNYLKEANISFVVTPGVQEGKDSCIVSQIDSLVVRSWLKGDKMYLPGLKGHKKLQDIFTDKKIPREERLAWPVVLSHGKIIWLPGLYKNQEPGGTYTIQMKRGIYHV